MQTVAHYRPCLSTTVDQHVGTHEPTGLPETRLTEVRTDISDYVSADDWNALADKDRRAATKDLYELHAARVDLASLPADDREKVQAEIEAAGCIDFTDIAPAIQRAIRELGAE